MCTLTYLPLAKTGYRLTHSRDEHTRRPVALPPQPASLANRYCLFPTDPLGGGTWIAASADRTICLLNGAFRAHTPRPPYRHSRGRVVLDAFDYSTSAVFIDHYDWQGLEPFTLLWADDHHLIELRWDENQLHVADKDPAHPHIWSSATLYDPTAVARREQWFANWLGRCPTPTLADIRRFHLTAGANDPANAVRMVRPGLATQSLTSVERTPVQTALHYTDLRTNAHTYLTIQPNYACY